MHDLESARFPHWKPEISKAQIGPFKLRLGTSNLRSRNFGFPMRESCTFEIVHFQISVFADRVNPTSSPNSRPIRCRYRPPPADARQVVLRHSGYDGCL